MIHYTPRQTEYFLKAIDRNASLQMKADALVARIAQGDWKVFQSFLATLKA